MEYELWLSLKNQLLSILEILFDVTNLRLNLPKILLNIAFRFQLFIADELSRRFLDRALCLLNTALNLIFVHAHDLLLKTYAGKRPARRVGRLGKPTCDTTQFIVDCDQRMNRQPISHNSNLAQHHGTLRAPANMEDGFASRKARDGGRCKAIGLPGAGNR